MNSKYKDHFTSGESDVDIQDSVRGKNVYIVQSSGRDSNNHLMGLLLFVQASFDVK